MTDIVAESKEDLEAVNQPLASTNAKTYGSASEDYTTPSKHSFVAKIHDWGGPESLLLLTWITLIPILGPLYVISFKNFTARDFTLNCSKIPFHSELLDQVCNLSYPCVLMFPCLSRVSALGLATWSFAQQRIFYVLLQHKILVDFDPRNFASRIVLGFQLLLLAGAMVHLGIHLAWGHKGNSSSPYLLQTSLWDLINNPMQLLEPGHKKLLAWIIHAGGSYLGPAFLAVIFTHVISDVDSSTIPLIKMYEANPYYVHHHLSESVALCEGAVRELILSEGVALCEGDAKTDGGSINVEASNSILQHHDLADVCDTLRQEALAFRGISTRIGSETDVENEATCFGRSGVSIPPTSAWDFVTQTWWPLHIILKYDSSHPERVSFRTAWVIHCTLCALFLTGDAGLRFLAIWLTYGKLNTSKAESGAFVWCYFSFLGGLFIAGSLLSVRALVGSIFKCMQDK